MYLIVSFPLGNLDGTKLHLHLLWRISLKWLPSNKYSEVIRNFFESFSLHENNRGAYFKVALVFFSSFLSYSFTSVVSNNIIILWILFLTSSVQKLSSTTWLPLLDYGKFQRCEIHFWFRILISFTARVTFSNRPLH